MSEGILKAKTLAWKKKYQKYRDEVLKYELYAQRQFSVHNMTVFFLYGVVSYFWNRFFLQTSIVGSFLCMGVCLLSMADYIVCKIFLQNHIKYAAIVANIYILILGKMLLSIDLIWNEGHGGNVSWTLLVCSLLTTTMISIVPTHYAMTMMGIVLLDAAECIVSHQGGVALLYNLLDGILIFIFGIGMNLIYSGHKYAEFIRKEELKLESNRDMLTKLYNRRYIESHFDMYAKSENLCAMMVLDLDNFKMANDIYGHKKGDEVLCAVSDILRRSFRDEDCVARLGGDEFAVFLPKISKKETVVERTRAVLEKFPIVVDEEETVEVSVSIGIAYKNPGEQADYTRLCQKADEAMYQAKRLGKGKAVISSEWSRKEAVIVA